MIVITFELKQDEQFEILSKQQDHGNCFLTLEDLGNMSYAAKVINNFFHRLF